MIEDFALFGSESGRKMKTAGRDKSLLVSVFATVYRPCLPLGQSPQKLVICIVTGR